MSDTTDRHAIRNFHWVKEWGPAAIIVCTTFMGLGQFKAVMDGVKKQVDTQEARIIAVEDKVETLDKVGTNSARTVDTAVDKRITELETDSREFREAVVDLRIGQERVANEVKNLSEKLADQYADAGGKNVRRN